MNDALTRIQQQHAQAVDGFFAECSAPLANVADACVAALKNGKKLMFCGNGGSACDAMHIAGEFVGRFVEDRPSLAAIALTADAGILTAVANDYAYDYVFARQVEGLGQAGDVLIALSTSGSSPNVLKAITSAKNKGISTVLFTGDKGKQAKVGADIVIAVPSRITAHIQEAHMVGLHALACLVEAQLEAA